MNEAEFIAFNVDCKSFEMFKVDDDDDVAAAVFKRKTKKLIKNL